MKKALLVGINSKYIHPSMGVFQLYSNLKDDYIDNVNYIEFTIKDKIEYILETINNYNSDLICLSCSIWNIEIIKEVIKSLDDKYIIVLGGPEATNNPMLLCSTKASYIISSEGEVAFNEFLDYINGYITIDKVSNLYYLDSYNNLKFTYLKLPNILNVKHDLTLIKDYQNRICYLEGSRGCYYNCTYCLASTEKPVRFFPIEEIKNNILFLLQNNAKIVKFLDRSFNIKKDFINEILLFIKDNDNLYTTFQFEVNGDLLEPSTINILNSMRKKMIRLEIGIQSTNEETQKAIKRHQNFEKLKNNILLLKDNTVIHTDLICGLPKEDFTSFKKSFNDCFMLFTEELQLGILKELKGTFLSNNKDLDGFIFSTTSPYEIISNNYITNDEIKIVKKVEKSLDKFYNQHFLIETMNFLFNTLNLDPFNTFLKITDDLENNKTNMFIMDYDFSSLIKAFYDSVKELVGIDNQEYLLFLIKKDYLKRSKIKPKIFWEKDITRSERNIIYNKFKDIFNLNIDELYKYCHLERYNNIYFIKNFKDNKYYEIIV